MDNIIDVVLSQAQSPCGCDESYLIDQPNAIDLGDLLQVNPKIVLLGFDE